MSLKVKDRSLELVEWIDAIGVNSDWRDERSGWPRQDKPVRVHSVGYVIAEDKHAITVAPHAADETDRNHFQHCGTMVIPKRAIARRRRLVPKKPKR